MDFCFGKHFCDYFLLCVERLISCLFTDGYSSYWNKLQWYGCCTHCYFCTPYFLSVSTHYKLIDGWQWVTKSAIVYMVTEQLLYNRRLVVDKNRHCPTRPSHPWLRSPSAHYWPFQNLLLSSQDRVWMNEWMTQLHGFSNTIPQTRWTKLKIFKPASSFLLFKYIFK